MPRDGYTSITVKDETADVINRHIPEKDTQDEYLRQAARMANPYPNGVNEELRLDEHTRTELVYVDTVTSGRENNTEVELYYWKFGEQFLNLPLGEIYNREEDKGEASDDE